MSEENQYILYHDNPQHPQHPQHPTQKKTSLFFKCLAILFAGTVSTICSLYIMMIYHDIHQLYLSFQDTSFYFNSSNIQMLHEQMEFITYCISEKYCKRIQ
jgi:hypothetical protein